jgi:hypothetical protein
MVFDPVNEDVKLAIMIEILSKIELPGQGGKRHPLQHPAPNKMI